MKLDDITKKLELLRKEWDELVPAAKYSIIFGALLILLIWVDKVLDLNFYKSLESGNLGVNFGNFYFLLANLLILLSFPFLIAERGWINLKKIYYKFQYPLKDLNSKFYVISFKGRVCILDVSKKELKWLKTWDTALDLDLIGEWTEIDVDLTKPSALVNTSIVTKDGITLKLKDFKYVNGIHTQRPPGT